MKKSIVMRGFTTGLFLQLAIGPVFVLIINISLQQGLFNGLFAVLGVVLVDYLYIILAVLGVGKFLEIDKIKKGFSLLSSAVLIIFGILLLLKGIQFNNSEHAGIIKESLSGSFISTFFLTLSSPLTIVFWTGIFANRASSLNKSELTVFGISAGAATIIFLGISVLVLSLFRLSIPVIAFKGLNITVGVVLILFGLTGIVKQINWSTA